MINLRDYGYRGNQELFEDGSMVARVTEVHRERYMAICPHGEVWAALTGSFVNGALSREDYPTVGDFVRLRHNELGVSTITKLLPRHAKFARTDMAGHGEYAKAILPQMVAANFDYVFIMSSLNMDFSVNRILRYATLAQGSGAEPVILLTKADLCDDPSDKLEEVRRMTGGVTTLAVSSHTGQGLEALAPYLAPGNTVVFLGMSGVGKSSLLNALYGRDIMAVREIREDDSRGRHTTTHRQLVMLPSGAMVIDTPGMRELGLWDAEESIGTGFPDVEELFTRCRFSNCGHGKEPGCAVKAAIRSGALPEKRWNAYLSQVKEVAYVQKKAAINAKQKKTTRPKERVDME